MVMWKTQYQKVKTIEGIVSVDFKNSCRNILQSLFFQ